MHLPMLIWIGGGGGGWGESRTKARDLNLKQFFMSNAQPQGHHNIDQKRTNSPPLQLKLVVKGVLLKQKNIPTF